MERLLLLKLQTLHCTAEVALNGVPLLRSAGESALATLAVHEYVLSGGNRLQLTIEPDASSPTPRGAPWGARGAPLPQADCRLLLPRMGHPADETRVRTLGELAWAAEAGQRAQLPLELQCDVNLPIAFPRWRWLDAPVVDPRPPLPERVHDWLETLREDLARGQTEAFVQACRLRTEELALAYQCDAAGLAEGLREHLAQCSERCDGAWLLPPLEELQLRAVAGGRLLECLDAKGEAALRTEADADGTIWRMPLRLAVVEGRFYVLR